MATGIFYRNVRARDQLELFLLSAVSSLLLVRFYLYAAGYPQLGGGGLHIAHMLWGGGLMLVGLVIALSFLGARTQRVTAIVGGIGFGVFIDELGKFITHDNDYFYRPAIGIIYAIFIVLYLAINFLSRNQSLTSRSYQLNALAQLEEALVHDMDPAEKARVRDLLLRADQHDPVTKQLQKLLGGMRTIPQAQPSPMARLARFLDQKYIHFWKCRDSELLVRGFFLLEIVLFAAGVLGTMYLNAGSIVDIFSTDTSYPAWTLGGQVVSAIAAAGFAIWGMILLPRARLRAYEQFRRAALVQIFLTQFFLFLHVEFAALPGFFANIVLLGLIGYAIRQEQRLTTTA